jgi:hypothetical protein
MRIIKKFLTLAIAPFLLTGLLHDVDAASGALSGINASLIKNDTSTADEGIRFSCDSVRFSHIKTDMDAYFALLGISPTLIIKKTDVANGIIVYTLNTPKGDFDTLQLKATRRFAIHDQIISLPAPNGKTIKVVTVSRKEILLALLQHGRLTEFSGENCKLDALKSAIAIRQNIVAWSENLNWRWPDGEAAEWSPRYWLKGTPLPTVTIQAAFYDAFHHQKKYSIGCYTATKMVIVQGILDYFRRVKKNKSELELIEARLAFDPLVNVEPGEMWSFEQDFDRSELPRPGKLLQIQYDVAPKNFVPGDWVYLINNDALSSQKTGYEGSNAIYLGRNKFDDYYNDNGHSYTYKQKLNEVYQWRNGVFSRHRDASKMKPLSQEELDQLGKTPSEGGLVMEFRVFPYIQIPRD